ncbi:MAG: hemin uptake protein HemP [Pirellulales bacterium]|nr:hemin uptake protein HemP [Pirellulales bacterium]
MTTCIDNGTQDVKRDPSDDGQPAKTPASSSAKPSHKPRRVQFEDLAGGHHTLIVEYNGQEYYLRTTKTGRLLLTK